LEEDYKENKEVIIPVEYLEKAETPLEDDDNEYLKMWNKYKALNDKAPIYKKDEPKKKKRQSSSSSSSSS
jgi:hypothetical protein